MSGLVSVIVPTYYRNSRLEECLGSVRESDYERTEVIVVDDSGEEHAESVVDSYDVTYLAHSENRGAQAARSTGLQAASGEFVQFLDDDDRIREGKIRKQVAVLDGRPEVGVVYCGLTLADGTRLRPDPTVRGDVLEAALAFRDSTWKTSTMLIRRSDLEKVLPLEVDSRGADDVRLRIKLARETEFDYITDPAVQIGEGPDRRGDSRGAIDGLWEIIEEYEPLYESVDSRVRRGAIATTHGYAGRYYLRQKGWSARAIAEFARAAYFTPDHRLRRGGELLASLFGRPGMNVGSYLARALS
jgi:glycosyltransferase involved in cell wall biosynthesis